MLYFSLSLPFSPLCPTIQNFSKERIRSHSKLLLSMSHKPTMLCGCSLPAQIGLGLLTGERLLPVLLPRLPYSRDTLSAPRTAAPLVLRARLGDTSFLSLLSSSASGGPASVHSAEPWAPLRSDDSREQRVPGK